MSVIAILQGVVQGAAMGAVFLSVGAFTTRKLAQNKMREIGALEGRKNHGPDSSLSDREVTVVGAGNGNSSFKGCTRVRLDLATGTIKVAGNRPLQPGRLEFFAGAKCREYPKI